MVWLEATHLCSYQQGDIFFNHLCLQLRQGQRLGIMGATGAGKSWLLALLAQASPAPQGTVRHALGLRVAYLPEFSGLEPSKGNSSGSEASGLEASGLEASGLEDAVSVWDYAQRALDKVRELEQALRHAEKKLFSATDLQHYHQLQEDFEQLGGYQAEKKLRHCLEQCGISTTLLPQTVQTLTQAQQQQLRFAMLLSQQPELIILDMPFAVVPLDMKVRLERILQHYLRKRTTALIVASHDRVLLESLGTTRYWLRDGALKKERFSSQPSKAKAITSNIAEEVAGERLLEQDEKPYFQLKKGQKIAFSPLDNGFVARMLQTSATICYWDKHYSPLDESAWQTLRPYLSGVQSEILLAQVGLSRQQHTPIHKLSKEQQARLMLAWLQAQQAELIILEHACQHLDLPARDVLAEYLRRSPASVVLHDDDRQLLRICDNCWHISADAIVSYADVASFLAQKAGKRLEPQQEKRVPAPSPLQQEAYLEERLLALEERLALPLLERERVKLKNEYNDAQTALFLLYEARIAQHYPPLQPEYRAIVAGVSIAADKNKEGNYDFSWQGVVQANLQRQKTIGHIRLVENHACLLPWGKKVLLEAISQIAFERLECHVVQLQSAEALSQTDFQHAGHGWWVYARHDYVRQ